LDHFTGNSFAVFFAETDVPCNEGSLIVAWPLPFARCAEISSLQVYELG
jgi:hypothetical protein